MIADFLLLQAEPLFKIVLSALLAGLIGLEREKKEVPAGMRTFMLVCIASMLATMISLDYFPNADSAARVITGLLTGMGFLGAGTIMVSKNRVHGLTTAAGLWSMCILGIAVGLGMYFVSLAFSLVVYFVLKLKNVEKKYIDPKKGIARILKR
jgi:putative Mg2+ transporter-C (MgtC) family protein